MSTKKIEVSTKMEDWIKSSGWTVAELAELLGVTRAAIYPWLTGESKPSADVLARLELLSHGKITARAFLAAAEKPAERSTSDDVTP